MQCVRIPIKATTRVSIKQAGYISATSETQQNSLLQTAVGPYIPLLLVDQVHRRLILFADIAATKIGDDSSPPTMSVIGDIA